MGTGTSMTHVDSGRTAPGFSLKGLDGMNCSLEALRQKGPVVAVFLKLSRPVCQFAFPFLERLYQRYGSDTGTFLAICHDDTSTTAGFPRTTGLPLPTAL